LLFLGDRWELWGVTLPAFLHGIPLAHISGGEVTEGVIDDAVRHAHTKISVLHFVATDMYAANISGMGEEDWRINVTGECGIDQIHESDFVSSDIIKSSYDIDLEKETLLVTFHPSTLEFETPVAAQIDVLLQALMHFADRQLVFTAPGVEQGSQTILEAIHNFVTRHPSARFVPHFSSRSYLAVMRAAKVVIGNSSSGLTEASSLGVPAINVGKRQKNRVAADSVQHVGYDARAISRAIEHALTADFQNFARNCPNPYDPFKDGKNADRIIEAVTNALRRLSRERLLVKKYDNRIDRDQWNQLLDKNFAI
jgi:UDP-hydrolysing UDP-N-acetyl-D-glucosamine 2-epimerase